jgi:hypothetical protein
MLTLYNHFALPVALFIYLLLKFLSIRRISMKFFYEVLSLEVTQIQGVSVHFNQYKNNVESRIHEARTTVVSLTSYF